METEPALIAAREPPVRQMWIEVCVVLAVGVFPNLMHALYGLVHPTDAASRPGFVADAAMLIVHSVPIAVVVLFIMWRSGEGWRRFGLVPLRPIADPAIALGIVLAAYAGMIIVWMMIMALPIGGLFIEYDMAVEDLFALPMGAPEHALLAVMSLVNGCTEQLVISAFLFTRLERLLKSSGLALLACMVLFASYHIYQGPVATFAILLYGAVLIGAFAVLRRYWPIALAHGMMDFFAYVGA